MACGPAPVVDREHTGQGRIDRRFGVAARQTMAQQLACVGVQHLVHVIEDLAAVGRGIGHDGKLIEQLDGRHRGCGAGRPTQDACRREEVGRHDVEREDGRSGASDPVMRVDDHAVADPNGLVGHCGQQGGEGVAGLSVGTPVQGCPVPRWPKRWEARKFSCQVRCVYFEFRTD